MTDPVIDLSFLLAYRSLYIRRKDKSMTGSVISILGVPFDSTVSYRPGSRFAPLAIREALENIEFYSIELGSDLEDLEFNDLGDLSYTHDVKQMLHMLGRLVNEIKSGGCIPCVLGGEHTLTLASYSVFSNESVLVVFDAHLDLRDELYGLKLSHATFMRRLLENNRPKKVVYIGVRAAVREEWEYAENTNLVVCDVLNTDKASRILRELSSKREKIYVSLDLDVLDPAFAPGVSCPEPGGLTSRELLNLLACLKGARIVGFDVVELSPPYDYSGTTSVLAAKTVVTLSGLALMGLGKIGQ
jgi:agmatinase